MAVVLYPDGTDADVYVVQNFAISQGDVDSSMTDSLQVINDPDSNEIKIFATQNTTDDLR